MCKSYSIKFSFIFFSTLTPHTSQKYTFKMFNRLWIIRIENLLKKGSTRKSFQLIFWLKFSLNRSLINEWLHQNWENCEDRQFIYLSFCSVGFILNRSVSFWVTDQLTQIQLTQPSTAEATRKLHTSESLRKITNCLTHLINQTRNNPIKIHLEILNYN